MITNLYIRNIALIEECNIQFSGGLNVLSGETGAGKSVIIDSINFVLGSKADKSMIRYGMEEALVRAEFYVGDNPAASAVLSEFDIDSDGETIIISRKFTVDGRSTIKVNGESVTVGMLKKIATHLVDVHGQSEHFFLLSEANQLSVIDDLCGEKLVKLKLTLKEFLDLKTDCRRKIEELGGSEQDRAQKIDILAYQINEIENADVKVGEIEELKNRKRVIDNAERVINALNSIKGALSDDNCCIDLLSYAKKQSASIADFGDEYSNVTERLENIEAEAEDISDSVGDMLDDFSYDADEAESIESRLTLYKNLTNKYGGSEESVLAYLESAKIKIEALEDAADELERLNSKISDLNEKIYKQCLLITETRKAVCESFCSDIVEQLKTLNIPMPRFYVDFAPYDSSTEITSPNGADKISFIFSANNGEPPKPLSKIISGGEMSRFMLAIKTRLKGLNGITTYIFDEIDSGISGYTARMVAKKLVSISKNTQIIAVSHLAQVCAAAKSEYLIAKSDVNGKTVTKVRLLTRDERIGEMVRLTGSLDSEAARKHADELLKQFDN